MTPSHCTNPPPPRTDPFRWPRADTARAFDHFAAENHPSQRQYAQQQGIPRSTLGYWLRRDQPADADDVAAFFHSSSGAACLRRLVLAAFVAFHERGACGLRLIDSFLQLAQLDRFVASSRGALQPLAAHLEADLGTFDDEQRPLLAQQMAPKNIAVAADENFHGQDPCLVAIEPVSNFILVECYRDRRDADTWTQALREGVRDLPVTVVLLNSDLARGLLCCAEKGLEVPHSPDLFHGQRDLLKPLLLPLARPVQQAEKDLEKARQHTAKVDVTLEQVQSRKTVLAIVEAVRHEVEIAGRLEEAQERQEQVVQQVRGLGDDYHPFDRYTGCPVTAEQVTKRLHKHLAQVEKVVAEAGLGERAREAVTKTRSWVGTLAACVAWFWLLTNKCVEDLELSDEQERTVYESLLPGLYWEQAAARARTGEERERLRQLATHLRKAAWQEGSVLASLPEPQQRAVQRVAQECAGLFSRSSSCVEGRNGRLSLHHHGQGRLSARKLKALTVIHNYGVKRRDGTTAAERFFGVKHQELFSWLLERLPDLPRPAAKRSQKAAESSIQGE
jgi:Family of unknown function (DUF6399)